MLRKDMQPRGGTLSTVQSKRTTIALLFLTFLIAATSCRGPEQAASIPTGQQGTRNEGAPLLDHHQHLLSPAATELQNTRRTTFFRRILGRIEESVTAEQLVA